MTATVYKITCIPTGDLYIGGTTTPLGRRWRNHKAQLKARRNKHPKIQALFDRFGIDQFKIEPVIRCRPEDVVLYEQLAMDAFKPTMNTAPNAGPVTGLKRTKEYLAAKSKAYTKTHKIGDEYLTVDDIMARTGLSRTGVYSRLRRGQDVHGPVGAACGAA